MSAVPQPVATITMNRPEAMNALTVRMLSEIRHAVAAAEKDERVVGIVLTGAGRGFCPGMDMNALDSMSSGSGSAQDDLSGLKADPGDPDMGDLTPETIGVSLAHYFPDNAIVVDEKDEIMVSIPADSIAEWRAHLRALRGLPTIDRVRVMQLSREGGVVQLNLSASMQSLLYALEATGLAIERKVKVWGRHCWSQRGFISGPTPPCWRSWGRLSVFTGWPISPAAGWLKTRPAPSVMT